MTLHDFRKTCLATKKTRAEELKSQRPSIGFCIIQGIGQISGLAWRKILPDLIFWAENGSW